MTTPTPAEARATLAEEQLARAVSGLTEIAESDDIDNALDPERNKRIAASILSDITEEKGE